MRTKEQIRRTVVGADGEQPEVPEDFICIDPEQQPLVFDFLNNSNQDIKETALMHLELCLHCREVAATIIKIKKYLELGPRHYLHQGKSSMASESEYVS